MFIYFSVKFDDLVNLFLLMKCYITNSLFLVMSPVRLDNLVACSILLLKLASLLRDLNTLKYWNCCIVLDIFYAPLRRRGGILFC